MKVSQLVIFLIIARKFSLALDEYGNCDYFQKLSTTSQFTIQSPGYPLNYLSRTKCRWGAEAPPGFKISIKCNDVRIPISFACVGDNLAISPTGRTDMADAKRYCGSSPFQLDSTNYRMTIALKAGALSNGSKFQCLIKAVKNNCSCGTRNRGRIGKMFNYVIFN